MRTFASICLQGFLRDTRGATSIEYALIASGISIVILATVNAMGTSLQGMYQSVSDALK
ncbi:MAG TPA: Flp family type IVb pilin [Pseudolabrys sp.]|nr:Flp family type IVb pilin [Pseudolabrys sp.]